MKKIFGVLVVAAIAATTFFNANNINSASSDSTLGSLLTMNTANAENGNEEYYAKVVDCTFVEPDGTGGYHFYSGQELECGGGFDTCTAIPCAKDVVINH